MENCSTEDVLHHMEEAGTNCPEDFKKRTSGFSMDVTSGYNSLDINKTARIVGDAIGKTPVDYPSFRPRPAILYIQAAWEKEGKPNIMQERGLGHLYIERHSNRGRKPTIYNRELTLRPMAENKEEREAMAQGNPKYSSWKALPKEPTKEERRKLVGLLVETNLRALLKCNIYTFGGDFYHQQEGGAIGSEATHWSFRFVMDEWTTEMHTKMALNAMKCILFLKYVDDTFPEVETLRRGSRWDKQKDCLTWSYEKQTEDIANNISPDHVTGEVLRDMGNSIFPFIQVTLDLPEDHPEGKVPLLDTQVWVEHGEGVEEYYYAQEERERLIHQGTNPLPPPPTTPKGRDHLRHDFYSKPMASKLVLDKASALSGNTKTSTLVDDIQRRMRNTDRMASPAKRGAILSEAMLKMRDSGYNLQARKDVLIRGLTGYYRKVEVERAGGQKVNRPRKTGAFQRRWKEIQKHKWVQPHFKQGWKPPSSAKLPEDVVQHAPTHERSSKRSAGNNVVQPVHNPIGETGEGQPQTTF